MINEIIEKYNILYGFSKENEKIKKISICVEVFKAYDYEISDKDLTKTLNNQGIKISQTVVCRNLNDDRIKLLFGDDEYERIQQKRNENLKKGNLKGGLSYKDKYDSTQDSKGHFTGSIIKK